MEPHLKLLKLILPDFLAKNFKLVSFENYDEKLHLYFEQESTFHNEFSYNKLVPVESPEEIIIEDFPLMSKLVYLHIYNNKKTLENKHTSCFGSRESNSLGIAK